jgi:hypothetical protein
MGRGATPGGDRDSGNGYTLPKTDYPYLFSAIRTLYNSSQEDSDHFSIPNYNNERRFLQASQTAGNKTPPGLSEVSGWISNVWQRNLSQSYRAQGAFSSGPITQYDPNTRGSPNYDSHGDLEFRASYHIFIIKYK